MVDFAEHRKALLCNDAASIADYQAGMDQATKAVGMVAKRQNVHWRQH